jgi:hypothetical protein
MRQYAKNLYENNIIKQEDVEQLINNRIWWAQI